MEQIIERIKALCAQQTAADPVAIAEALMSDPLVRIHGPEHHILDGAALLTAIHNAGESFDLPDALDELARRGSAMPGATCGQWGVCGSVSSAGAALSILHGTGPLSDSQFYKDNMQFTSTALWKLSEIGGPRCCKRNAFLSLTAAAEFVREHYNISLETHTVKCRFFPQNQQCIGTRCPFHPTTGEGKSLPKVAFICVHNSCRSQMAEALGKHLAAHAFKSYSAGTETKPQINQDAVRIMKDLYAIDMEATQRPKLLSELPPVDIVITMGCNVSCPSLPCKHREDWGLDDPSGKPDADFIQTARKLEKNIHTLVENLPTLLD